jgi:hypothetical protein
VSKGVGGHQQPHRGKTDDWLTPPEVVAALGHFDLDPACPPSMPWPTADRMLTPADDGFNSDWSGRVWLNPPYGPETGRWLWRLADHGDGVALVFARTETADFFRCVWDRADAVLFLKGRLHFHDRNGVRAKFNSGAPSVLVAYGDRNCDSLDRCGLAGKFIRLRRRL